MASTTAELVAALGDELGVDVGAYCWYRHHCGEGCDPFWLVLPAWWHEVPKIPIRVTDLVQSARLGVWSIGCPDEPVNVRPDVATWVMWCFLAIVLAIVALLRTAK